MALASTDILCTVPLASFVMYLNGNAQSLQPWESWENVHYNWSRVVQIPAIIWHQDHLQVVGIELTRWAVPACSLLFFVFFGFAHEARKNYRRAFWAVAGLLGCSPARPKSPSAPTVRLLRKPQPTVSVTLDALPSYPMSATDKNRPDSFTSSIGDSKANEEFSGKSSRESSTYSQSADFVVVTIDPEKALRPHTA